LGRSSRSTQTHNFIHIFRTAAKRRESGKHELSSGFSRINPLVPRLGRRHYPLCKALGAASGSRLTDALATLGGASRNGRCFDGGHRGPFKRASSIYTGRCVIDDTAKSPRSATLSCTPPENSLARP
jgi:hypothetical protein